MGCRMRIQLWQRHVGNVAMVKLIDQEDRMLEYGDPHPIPNVDISFVRLRGRKLCPAAWHCA